MPRDHYISQVYLRMFRANKKNQIFVCEKGTGGTSSLASIEDVAQEVDFYSKHTNNKFSGIESRAKKWLDKLKNHKNQPSITSDEKKEIAEFVALIHRRVPAGYERKRNIAPEPEKDFMAIEFNVPIRHSKSQEMSQATGV